MVDIEGRGDPIDTDETTIEGGPEPLTEDEMGSVRAALKSPRPEMRKRVASKVATILIVLILVLVVWQVFFTANDRSDWAYEMTQLNTANEQGLTGEGIRVAVVDTGIKADHPALEDANIVLWKDFVNGRSKPYDDQGHGTAMASIIVGSSPIRGGAVDVELIVVKVLDEEGASSDARVANGIWFCIDPNGDGDYRDGADVISLSLGGRTRYLAQIIGTKSQEAIHEAARHGILVVAASGNDGENDDGDVASPGWIVNVICVGAVDGDGRIAIFSSRGRNLFKQDPNKKPEVVAPGVDIVSASHRGGYRVSSGTSQATAFMSACLAVTLSALPQFAHDGAKGGDEGTVLTIKWAIYESSKKIGGQTTPHDNRAGYGLVQTLDLIDALEA